MPSSATLNALAGLTSGKRAMVVVLAVRSKVKRTKMVTLNPTPSEDLTYALRG